MPKVIMCMMKSGGLLQGIWLESNGMQLPFPMTGKARDDGHCGKKSRAKLRVHAFWTVLRYSCAMAVDSEFYNMGNGRKF